MGLYDQESSGSMGSVQVGGREREHLRKPGVVVVRLAMSTAVIGLIWYVALLRYPVVTGKIIFLGLLIMVAYLAAAFFLRPKADMSNLGMNSWGGGGLFRRRARLSQSFNQWMLVGSIALWPGRFVAESLYDLWWLVTGRNAEVESEPVTPDQTP